MSGDRDVIVGYRYLRVICHDPTTCDLCGDVVAMSGLSAHWYSAHGIIERVFTFRTTDEARSTDARFDGTWRTRKLL